MRQRHAAALVGLVALMGAAGCATTGKTVGQTIDDTALTTQIKAKLAQADVRSLYRVNVDTDRGIVYLTGSVPTEEEKQRLADLIWRLNGVRAVVNELQVRG
jgi:osmotically-inducible protein OsmY